uniref:Uncharacterized protein n=1 Tax=Arundo donax TaxID=35708 RepID=A0A0A9D9W1_ARUDO
MAFLCPLSTMKFLHSPWTYHKKISLSWEPDAITVPAGLNFMQ